jgi:hypothetical protein
LFREMQVFPQALPLEQTLQQLAAVDFSAARSNGSTRDAVPTISVNETGSAGATVSP